MSEPLTREMIDEHFTTRDEVVPRLEYEFIESVYEESEDVVCYYIVKFGSDELISTYDCPIWTPLRELNRCDDGRMEHVIKLIIDNRYNGDGKEMLLLIASMASYHQRNNNRDATMFRRSFNCVRRIYELDIKTLSETNDDVKYVLDIFYLTDV